jgi:UDP-N-acetylglucosamine 2-epimerase (non-hydrolysing)
LAPVADALAARGIAPRLIFTGQHPGLDPAEFGLGNFRAERLDCPGEANPDHHAKSVAAAVAPRLSGVDLLVVQGDTSSALGAAMAAFAAGTPVAHVEAGLRTHDFALPWPEEGYRTIIDQRAELLFAPTPGAAANLAAENISGAVHVTGNSGIDALLRVERKLPAPALRDGAMPRLLVTCHRRESWGAGLRAIAGALTAIANEGLAEIDVVLHPNAHVAATMRDLLGGARGINLIAPVSHGELVLRMRDCALILSDSGGIQEEAPALGTPLLVLRGITERPEGIASGNMRMVGTSSAAIVGEVRALLGDPAARAAMSRPSLPYGDGHAAPRIAGIIVDWLERRGSDIIVTPVVETGRQPFMSEPMSDLSILERAFALAQSGECSSIDDIRRKLKSERYESIDQHLAGPSIKRQLNQLCLAAKSAD